MPTQKYTAVLTIVECPRCHMDFGVTPEFDQHRVNDHQTFYCPAGHTLNYNGKSEAEKLKEKLAVTEQRLDWANDRAQGAERQRDAVQRSLSATKGVVTKIKKRVGNGVCPCCDRHFTDLERHMHNKHPEFKDPQS